jgi:hypothetical protein
VVRLFTTHLQDWVGACTSSMLPSGVTKLVRVPQTRHFSKKDSGGKYSAFNRGGNRERSVQLKQHLSRIAGVTADSGMSQQR